MSFSNASHQSNTNDEFVFVGKEAIYLDSDEQNDSASTTVNNLIVSSTRLLSSALGSKAYPPLTFQPFAQLVLTFFGIQDVDKSV